MKKFIFLCLLALFGLQSLCFAESYQRWIYWTNESDHVANANEMADIFSALSSGKIVPGGKYNLSSGVTFVILQPKLYYEYLVRCIQKSDPSAQTVEDMIKAIQGGQRTRWGNDISCRVKNYWTNSNGKISVTPNYSGAEAGVQVLLINGIPTIKLDCGNPLEIYGNSEYVQPTRNAGNVLDDFEPLPPEKTEPQKPMPSLRGNDDWSFQNESYEKKQQIDLKLPQTEESSSPKRKLSVGAKIAIGIASALVVGGLSYAAWEIFKPRPNAKEVNGGHGVDPPPPNPGGVGVDPPHP